jgi:hypothetical protein
LRAIQAALVARAGLLGGRVHAPGGVCGDGCAKTDKATIGFTLWKFTLWKQACMHLNRTHCVPECQCFSQQMHVCRA